VTWVLGLHKINLDVFSSSVFLKKNLTGIGIDYSSNVWYNSPVKPGLSF
jgi:hypothetical protein